MSGKKIVDGLRDAVAYEQGDKSKAREQVLGAIVIRKSEASGRALMSGLRLDDLEIVPVEGGFIYRARNPKP